MVSKAPFPTSSSQLFTRAVPLCSNILKIRFVEIQSQIPNDQSLHKLEISSTLLQIFEKENEDPFFSGNIR